MDTSENSLVVGANETARNEPPKEQSTTEDGVHVSLTYEKLDPTTIIGKVKSAKAGAVLLFAGMCLVISDSCSGQHHLTATFPTRRLYP